MEKTAKRYRNVCWMVWAKPKHGDDFMRSDAWGMFGSKQAAISDAKRRTTSPMYGGPPPVEVEVRKVTTITYQTPVANIVQS
jgi:hypothetical protein